MSDYPEAPAEAARPRLGTISSLARLALIGAALGAVAGAFAYLGGWFTPNELTPTRFADAFEHVDGVHPGFRRNHAKGLGVAGFFESNGNGVRLSKAVVFRPERLPVIGRFSLSGGQPFAADMPETVRGLALEFSLPGGELWRTAMINLPVVPASTPAAFYELVLASAPDPKTGKPDPDQMKSFLARHPESEEAMKVIKGRAVSSGFGNSTYHGLHAFRFINAAGDSIPVRWLMMPEQPFEAASTASAPHDKNYLFDALVTHLQRQPLRWHLIIIGQPGDPTHDPSIPWPEGREKVDVGTLTLDRVESDETSAATNINFDPLVLPVGIAPSDDPFLSARSAVYSQSFTRRAGETKQPGATPPAVVRKGG
ncbi:MAG: catalase family peroxidase [Isosphaeraceae bacterium]